MKKLVLYVHGKGGDAGEAKHYQSLFPDRDVIGLDYKAQNPWEARKEFPKLYESCAKGYDDVLLIANSIGAFFSMNALSWKKIGKALFISPVADMEKLILDMMAHAKVPEPLLKEKGEITTDFGETLSYEYLMDVREHPINWNIPTCILYGEKDQLTSWLTITTFANRIGARLTVMKDGEHWFHTPEQMEFLDNWIIKSIR